MAERFGAETTMDDVLAGVEEARQAMAASIDALRPEGAPPFRYKSVAQGAATSVWAGVVAPADLVGGRYCEDCRVAEVVDVGQSLANVRSYALDPRRAEALWARSEEIVGEKC